MVERAWVRYVMAASHEGRLGNMQYVSICNLMFDDWEPWHHEAHLNASHDWRADSSLHGRYCVVAKIPCSSVL